MTWSELVFSVGSVAGILCGCFLSAYAVARIKSPARIYRRVGWLALVSIVVMSVCALLRMVEI